MEKSTALNGGLSPLTPTYFEEYHAAYVEHLLKAITKDPPVHNVALAGAYGTGKSSILEGVKQGLVREEGLSDKDQMIEISLSNFNQPADSITQASGESSISAVLQKEVVKRLLYSKSPKELPLSRFKRIAAFDRGRAVGIAAAVTSVLLLALYVVFGSLALGQYFENRGTSSLLGLVLGSLILIAVLSIAQYVVHRHSVQELSFGAASIKLSDNGGTYFDQYLDEIIYFFKQTGLRYVILEDLDRFNDPSIFQALRDLNSILNAAESIEQPVVFIYAVRDSLFEPKLRRSEVSPSKHDDSAVTATEIDAPSPMGPANDLEQHKYGVSSPASDRAKFFDLIIPIVPFISSSVAADLLLRELSEKRIEDKARPSIDLVALAGRFFTDMRVIRSIANEYQLFANELLGKSKIRGLDPDKQFAMVLYKHAHLADFEKIRSGESRLDQLAKVVRDVTSDRVKAIDEEIAELRSETAASRKAAEKCEALGERLQALVRIGLQRAGLQPGTKIRLEPEGRNFDWDALKTEDFWSSFVTRPGPLVFELGGRTQLTLSLEDIETFIGRTVDLTGLRSQATEELENRVSTLRSLRVRNVESTFAQRVTDNSLSDSSTHHELPDLPDRVREILGEGLALELVRAGHLDNSFVLYASIYYGEILSVDARSFMLQVMDHHQSAPGFELSREDVDAILQEPGYDFLNSQSALNISVFDHMLEDDRLEPTIRRIVAGTLDEDGSFLDIFLARSEAANKLIARLAPIFDRTLDIIVENEQLEPDRKLSLLSTALAHLGSDVDYAASNSTLELIADSIDDLPVIREDLSTGHSTAFAAFLSQYSIAIASLEQMYEGVRRAVVEANAFEINRQNLLTLTPEAGRVGLDTLSRIHSSLGPFLVHEIQDYLKALEGYEDELLSVDNPEKLVEVLAQTTDVEDGSLDRLLTLAHPSAMVTQIADAPESSWSSLARTKRFMPTAANLVAYFMREADDDDYYDDLARSLSTTSEILAVDEVPEGQRIELAVWLVNHAEIPVETTLAFLSQLNLSEHLPLEALQIGDGQLLAGLITGDHVDDSADTLRHFGSLPWDQRELALSSSSHLHQFITQVGLRSEELVGVVQSSVISRDVKAAVLAGVNHFQQSGVLSRDLAIAIVGHATSEAVDVPDNDLSTLAAEGAPSPQIAKLLGRNVANRTNEGILKVLGKLRGEYKKLAVADGKRPKLAVDEDVIQLLERLKEMGLVSDHKPIGRDGRYLRVFMRRHDS